METIRSNDLAKQVDAVLERVAAGERIVVQSGDKQAVLVPTEDAEFLEEVDRKLDEQDAAEIDRRKNENPEPFHPSEILSEPSKSG